jgi:rare lipoprotein A
MNELTLCNEIKLQEKTGGRRRSVGVLAITLGLTASIVAAPPMKTEGTPSRTITSFGKKAQRPHWMQLGTASWYGPRFNGRKTATGEKYDQEGLSAAHRTLPLGTWLRVTNLHNKRVVFLRVNDRGPVSPRFIIDLSHGAAQRLGIEGIGKVRIEQLDPADKVMAEQMVASMKLDTDPAVLAETFQVAER